MEAKLIEKYDKERTRMFIGVVIGFSLIYGIAIFYDFFVGTFLEIVLKSLGIVGFGILFYCASRIIRLRSLFRKNLDLKAALTNEWILNNLQKARSRAFFILLISIVISCGLTLHSILSPLFLMELCILVGVLSVLMSFILLNRES